MDIMKNVWSSQDIDTMTEMFNYATNFNQDISNWDVSKVINMVFMFEGASNFNQDISGWDVSNVTNMAYMFNCCFQLVKYPTYSINE